MRTPSIAGQALVVALFFCASCGLSITRQEAKSLIESYEGVTEHHYDSVGFVSSENGKKLDSSPFEIYKDLVAEGFIISDGYEEKLVYDPDEKKRVHHYKYAITEKGKQHLSSFTLYSTENNPRIAYGYLAKANLVNKYVESIDSILVDKAKKSSKVKYRIGYTVGFKKNNELYPLLCNDDTKKMCSDVLQDSARQKSSKTLIAPSCYIAAWKKNKNRTPGTVRCDL